MSHATRFNILEPSEQFHWKFARKSPLFGRPVVSPSEKKKRLELFTDLMRIALDPGTRTLPTQVEMLEHFRKS
eukprot:s913_g9.t1